MGLSILNIDPDKPETISKFVQDAWAVRHYYKFALERQWFINIAWFRGNQNVIWDDVSRILRQPAAPPWRVRLVINLLQGVIRTHISKLVRPRYEPDVIPPTEDPIDIETALLDKQILSSYWKTEHGHAKLLDAVEWMCTTGNAFIKVTWNPDKGEQLSVAAEDLLDEYYETTDPERSARLASASRKFNQQTEGMDVLYTGDMEIEVVPPFEMFIDPLATHGLDDANWVLRTRQYDVNAVKEDWGEAAEGLAPDSNYISTGDILNYRDAVQRLTSSASSAFMATGFTNNTILVHELYVKKRSKGKLKDGLYAVIAGGKVLNNNGKATALPYNHGRIPIIQLQEIPVKGSCWATSTLEQLLSVQADYNRTKSQLVENRNQMGKPKWLMPKGGGIPDAYIDNEPGQIIEYTQGFKPEMISPPPMPSYIENLLTSYRQDIEDISGQHEVSRAEAPGEVRSGRGVLALIEQDETRLGPIIERIDLSVAEMGKLILSTLTQFVKEKRVSRLIGEDDELIITEWDGKDLLGGKFYGRPDYAYFDVRVNTITGLPNSRSAQISLIDSLTQSGYLNPQQDRRLVFRLLQIGKVQSVLDSGRIHRTRAIQENKRIAEGEQPTVEPFQDHEIHLELHNLYRNSTQYDRLPDEIKQYFTVHEQQHKEMAALQRVEPSVLDQKAISTLISMHGLAATASQPQQQGQQATGEPNG